MAFDLVRFEKAGKTQWGRLHGGKVYPLSIDCTTTQALLENNRDTIIKSAVSDSSSAFDLQELALLSPITSSSKVLCQGANYRQHMIDSGMDPDVKKFNMFFTKSSASIHEPEGKVIRPKHVSLLDYEIELTLVLAKKTLGTVQVTDKNMHEFVAGVCIGNDISARDIQIPQMQFHKGKSYRTFCPLGPILCLLEKDEMHYLNELDLKLTVNGETRQQDSSENLVFKPGESLSELSEIHDFEPGDVVMTGTPSGCALGLPSPLLIRLVNVLPEHKKWQLFLKKQSERTQYLKIGDRVESTIVSRDGRINLGKQSHEIVGA